MRRHLDREQPGISNKEQELIQAILDSPEDDSHRLVYADWLEEQGDEIRSRYLKLEVYIAEERSVGDFSGESRAELIDIGSQVGAGWTALVSRVRIERCEFEFECPKKWTSLTPTKNLEVRFCDACEREVFFCHTIKEAKDHARNGECVAIDLMVPRESGDLQVRSGPGYWPRTQRTQSTMVLGRMGVPQESEVDDSDYLE